MAYDDLSQEQKDQLDGWSTDCRAFLGDLQRLINRGQALYDAYWAAGDGIQGLWSVGGSWVNSEPIPNKSGLAGSSPLTKDDHVDFVTNHLSPLVADASSFTSGLNTDPLRQERVVAAGPSNT